MSMQGKSSWANTLRQWGWLILPLGIALFIMLPRLAAPQFNFEDDGISLHNAIQVLKGDFRFTLVDFTNRFRPLYWLGFVPLYLIGGKNPLWYFLSNTLIFAGITLLVMLLVRIKAGTPLQACLAGILFVLSGPVIETFYTISKPEGVQLFWLLLSLVLVEGVHPGNRRGRIGIFLAAAVCILCALLVKETTLVILPIAFLWLALEWVVQRKKRPDLASPGIYALAGVAAAAVFLLFEYHFLGGILTGKGYGGHYTLTPGFMLFMSYAWAGWLLRDFMGLFFCLPLLAVSIRKDNRPGHLRLLVGSSLWMGCWIAIFLPWDRTLEYYLLPFAVGCSIFCAALLGEMILRWKTIRPAMKILASISTVLFSLFFLTTLLNNFTNAKLQLAMDRQEARLMEYVTADIQPGALILANFDANSTYFSHALDLFQVVGNRADIKLQPFEFQVAQGGEPPLSYYLITAQVQNKPLFAVRSQGDMSQANAALQGIISPTARPVFLAEQGFPLITFNLINLICPLVRSGYLQDLYCSHHLPVVDTRPYTYSWQVYHVNSNVSSVDLPAVFRAGEWSLEMEDGSIRQLHFGSSAALPLSGDWNGSGRTGIGVFDPATLTWSLDADLDGIADQTFQLRGMTAADIPLTGDWNCQGRDTPGYFRPADGSWHLWTANYSGPEDIPVFGGTESDVLPLVGDWDGDGCDTVGIYRPARGEVNLENSLTGDLQGVDFYVPKNALPVVGHWGGNAVETLAFFDAGKWVRLFANCECPPANPAPILLFGGAGDRPLAGKWRPGD